MAGRIGNKGYSYFSESAFHNLEDAVKLMSQYLDLQKKVNAQSKNNNADVDKLTRYAQQLKDLGIEQNQINERHLKNRREELAIEQERYAEIHKQNKEKQAQQKRDERAREFEKAFQLETSNRTKEEIEQQRKLDNIKEEGLKKVQNLRLGEKKRAEIIKQTTKEYNEQLKVLQDITDKNKAKTNKDNIKKDFIQNVLGTNTQAIQDIKEGTYWWKFGTKVFQEAVNTFKRAVEASIEKNYNSTESTLNRITASNRMSWSSGSFKFNNRTYTGYQNVNNAINDKLWQEGLYNNIANTDVMEATAVLTSSGGFGFDEDKVAVTALEKAYQDTVIKYIVPYLDTANEAYEMLEMTMPRNVKKCSSYKYIFKRTIW